MNENIEFNVGVIVEIDPRFADGERGIIYERYQLSKSDPPGHSVVTESGRDLGGFSHDECLEFLTPLRQTGCDYEFTNAMNLHRDFNDKIKPYFNN